MNEEVKKSRDVLITGVIALLMGATFAPIASGHITEDTIHSTHTSPQDSRLPVTNQDDMVTIVTHKCGPYGVEEVPIQVRVEEAKEITRDLERLKEAIQSHDKTGAFLLASKLKQADVFQDNMIFTLIENYIDNKIPSYLSYIGLTGNLENLMCLILGYGQEGTFVYPSEIFFYEVLDAIGDFIAYCLQFFISLFPILKVLWYLTIAFFSSLLRFFLPIALIAHAFPRFILPYVYLNIHAGNVTTVGLLGVKKPAKVSAYERISFIGFIGLTINIVYPDMESRPFFCLGFSPAVTREE